MGKVEAVPRGMSGITAHLVVRDAARAIEFYQKAFGATEISRFTTEDGHIMHAALQVGESKLYLNDEFRAWNAVSPESLGGTGVYLMLYVPDVDAVVKRATDAGAELKMPVGDQFWGDRYGMVADPFGHVWEIATHKEDVSPAEMRRRAASAMANR